MGPISYVHPKFRTPTVAIVVHVIVATILALISTFANMALFSAGARLTTYLFTCAAIPRLRKLNEGFRTPGLWMPILGTLILPEHIGLIVNFITMMRFRLVDTYASVYLPSIASIFGYGRFIRPSSHFLPCLSGGRE